MTAEETRKGLAAQLRCSRAATVDGKTMTVSLGDVGDGARMRFVVALQTRTKDGKFVGTVDERSAIAALDQCKNHWDQQISGTMQTRIEDQRLTDLLEDWKVLMLVQRCANSGGVAPMVNYRGTWIRDNTGPMLAFLRYGLFEEAKQLLDYVYRATLVTGELQNHFPLDLDVSKASEIEQTIRWGELRIPSTELAAWIILQHEWYYRATWDLEFIKARWPFLSVCYQALKPDADGSFPTHGDETYLHGAFFSLWPDRLKTEDGAAALLPADSPLRRARSFSNSALYLIAINAMAELIEDIEKEDAGAAANEENWSSRKKAAYDQYHVDYLLKLEDKFWDERAKRFAPFASPVTGQLHDAPYAPSNLLLQWIGYTYAIGEKNRENLKSTLSSLWQKDGRVGMTPTTGYVTGSVQGKLLYALTDLEDQRRDEALQALIKMAGPAGEWGELYDPEGHAIAGYNREFPNRLRPWESGINIDAIFFSLNGIRFVCSPGWSKKDQRIKLRVPGNSKWLTMRGVQHDDHLFDIFIDRIYQADFEAKEPTGMPESRMRFRIEYDRINKKAANLDWVDAAVNVGGTLYMRLPTLMSPIYEITPWPEDSEQFWIPRTGKGDYTNRPPRLSGNSLVLTTRLDSPDGGTRLDLGMPLTVESFRSLLLDGEKPRFAKVLMDVDARSANRATMKTEAWWKAADEVLEAYVKVGGKLIESTFIDRWSLLAPIPGTGVETLRADLAGVQAKDFSSAVDVDGQSRPWKQLENRERVVLDATQLGDGAGAAVLGTTLVVDKTRELILKVGCSTPFTAFLDGKKIELASKSPGSDRPDRFEVLVRLEKGTRRLMFALWAADGRASLNARFTGTDGMPVVIPHE